MLLRLPPTQSAVTKYMSCVDYRPWPYVLLPVRHENSGDRIPHRKVGFATSVHFFFIDRWVFDIGLLFYYPTDMRIPEIVYHIVRWDSLSVYIVYSIISLPPLVPSLPFCSSPPPSSGPRPFSSTRSSAILIYILYISHNSIYIYTIYGD